MHCGPPPHQSFDAHRTGSASETVCDRTPLVLSARSGSLRSRRLVPWGWGRWLQCGRGEKKRARNTERPGAFVPREPPWPAAFVPRSLLGVVVPGPGVPGRRERGRGSLAPIPREGPRGLLTQRVAGAARLDPERRCTWSPRRRRSQPALERGRSGVEGEATGPDSGAGLNIERLQP